MNFSLKCLHCKCRKWFTWGKFCRQCLEENDECIAGKAIVYWYGKEIGTCDHILINGGAKYEDVTKLVEGIENEID